MVLAYPPVHCPHPMRLTSRVYPMKQVEHRPVEAEHAPQLGNADRVQGVQDAAPAAE